MNTRPPDIRTLYLHHRDAIYRFVWRLTGSISTAEDVLQDCFISLLRSPRNYNPDKGPARAFLLGMARNIARKRWRTEQRWTLLDEETFKAEPVDLAQGEIADLVGRAIQSLPPLQREALILFEYEELSLSEIAVAVDAEVGTVKARLHRARENLKELLAPVVSTRSVPLNE